jgi:hypothetical protein
MQQYSWRVRAGTILSQAVNTLFCNGHPDQTLSSRAWTDNSERWQKVRRIADRLFGPGHCKESYEADIQFGYDIIDQKVEHD